MPLPTLMTYSQAGKSLTRQFESCRFESYQDGAGVWTIGWGHTRGVGKGLTCTQLQADVWEAEDRGYAEAAVNKLVNVPLTQGQFDALVDFCFNCGVESFHGSTMLKLLNLFNYHAAADEFEKWDHVAGKVCAGLLRRRQAEEQEFSGAD